MFGCKAPNRSVSNGHSIGGVTAIEVGPSGG
nr:MAG TPA: Protein of unknown function (DUF452) [Caudoviricetes sp.]DAZ76715.1 MAG TPA: Protein of unknown function (DUF452) [Caudoviricetes sp.]